MSGWSLHRNPCFLSSSFVLRSYQSLSFGALEWVVTSHKPMLPMSLDLIKASQLGHMPPPPSPLPLLRQQEPSSLPRNGRAAPISLCSFDHFLLLSFLFPSPQSRSWVGKRRKGSACDSSSCCCMNTHRGLLWQLWTTQKRHTTKGR